MSHTFVVSQATAVGDVATIVGTVDTVPPVPPTPPVPVAITMNVSALLQANTSGGLTAVKNLVAPAMLAAAVQNGLTNPNPPAAITQLPTGTFVQ